MSKVISIVNFKGGVEKTTFTVNLGASLSFYKGKKVLIIDIDPQSNSTSYLVNFNENYNKIKERNIYTLVEEILSVGTNNINLKNYILRTNNKTLTLDLLPCHFSMLKFDKLCNQYNKRTGRSYKYIIKDLLPYLTNYDYILIDTPPSIKTETLNAIIASKYFIVPYTPEPMVHHGFEILLNEIRSITLNTDIPTDQKCKFLGVIFTKVDNRVSKHKEFIDICVNRLKMDHMLELGVNPEYKNYFSNRIISSVDYIKSVDNNSPICIYNECSSDNKKNDKLIMDEFLERIGDN